MNHKNAQTNIVSMFQTSYPVLQLQDYIVKVKTGKVIQVSVSLHRTHSLQVTKGQGVEAKTKTTIFCHRAVLEVGDSPRGPHPCPVYTGMYKSIFCGESCIQCDRICYRPFLADLIPQFLSLFLKLKRYRVNLQVVLLRSLLLYQWSCTCTNLTSFTSFIF